MFLIPTIMCSLSLSIGATAANQAQEKAAVAAAPNPLQLQPMDVQPLAPMTLDQLRAAAGEEPIGPFECRIEDPEAAPANESAAEPNAAGDAADDEPAAAIVEDTLGPPQPDNLAEDDPMDQLMDEDEPAAEIDAEAEAAPAAEVPVNQSEQSWGRVSGILQESLAQLPAMLEQAAAKLESLKLDAMAQKLQDAKQ